MKKLFLMLMLFAPLSLFAQQKFGHLDTQSVMQAMPEFIKAKGEVDAKQKEKEDELKVMQDEFQRKVEDIKVQK